MDLSGSPLTHFSQEKEKATNEQNAHQGQKNKTHASGEEHEATSILQPKVRANRNTVLRKSVPG